MALPQADTLSKCSMIVCSFCRDLTAGDLQKPPKVPFLTRLAFPVYYFRQPWQEDTIPKSLTLQKELFSYIADTLKEVGASKPSKQETLKIPVIVGCIVGTSSETPHMFSSSMLACNTVPQPGRMPPALSVYMPSNPTSNSTSSVKLSLALSSEISVPLPHSSLFHFNSFHFDLQKNYLFPLCDRYIF